MFEAMDKLLKATYEALEPSDEEPFITEEETLPEEVMFWPDGAKTRNHELDEDWRQNEDSSD